MIKERSERWGKKGNLTFQCLSYSNTKNSQYDYVRTSTHKKEESWQMENYAKVLTNWGDHEQIVENVADTESWRMTLAEQLEEGKCLHCHGYWLRKIGFCDFLYHRRRL